MTRVVVSGRIPIVHFVCIFVAGSNNHHKLSDQKGKISSLTEQVDRKMLGKRRRKL